MRFPVRFAALAIVIAAAACAPARDASTAETRAVLFDEFKRGDATLTCTIRCISAWLHNHEQMRVLDSSGQWQPLAVLVSSTSYMKDLGYYYLGRAADGLNLPQAANRYYRQSYALATGSMAGPRCRDIQGDCNGVDLLAVLPARLQSGQGTRTVVSDERPQQSARLPRAGISNPFQFCQAVGDDDAPSRATGYTGGEFPRELDDPIIGQSYLWRCMDHKVMMCPYGANAGGCRRNAFGLSPSPTIRSACQRHPNELVSRAESDGSLFWDCRGTTPLLAQRQRLDRRGYAVETWSAARR